MSNQSRDHVGTTTPSREEDALNDTDVADNTEGAGGGENGSNGGGQYREIPLAELLTILRMMQGDLGNDTGGRAHTVSSSSPSPPTSPYVLHRPFMPIFSGHGHVSRNNVISVHVPVSDDNNNNDIPPMTGQQFTTDGFSQDELQIAIDASLADDASRGRPDIDSVIQRAESERDRRKIEETKGAAQQNAPTATVVEKKKEKPFYVCPKCNAEMDEQYFGAKMMHQSYRCDSCGYDELELLHQVTALVAAQSLAKIITYGKLTAGTVEDETVEAELICLKERIESDCLKYIVGRYKVEESSQAAEDEIQKKDCAISFCDGVCRKVKCCENHYIHLDCLFEHVLRSEQEYCPVCRDPFMVLLFYKLDPVRTHSIFLCSLSPFGKTRLSAFLAHSRHSRSRGNTKMRRDKPGCFWAHTAVPLLPPATT